MILTVMIPAYQSEETLKACILSALARLPKNSEVLVYLDGEDAKSTAVLEEITDNRLRTIVGKKNLGVLESRNILLNESKGKFVANLDSDDLVIGNRFKRQIRYLTKSQSHIVFMNAIRHIPDNKVLKFRPYFPFPMQPEFAPHALLQFNPFVNSTMLSTKAFLKEIGGFQGIPEDYDLWVRAALSGARLSRMKSYGVVYRVHKTQLSQKPSWIQLLKRDKKFQESKNLLTEFALENGILVEASPGNRQFAERLPFTLQIEMLGLCGTFASLMRLRNLEMRADNAK